MKWFAVHALLGHIWKDEGQVVVHAFENILLISASDHKEAREKAELISREQEGDSEGTLTIGGHPASLKFMGIRKSVLCTDAEQRPQNGTEISYSEFEFATVDDLEKYVKGADVPVRFCDGLNEDKT